MSVSYEIRERFSTTSTSGENNQAQGARQIIQRQMALLFMKQLCIVDQHSDVFINDLEIELDGKSIVHNRNARIVLTDEIQEAIRGIADAKQIYIDIAYSYICRVGDDYLSIGPFVMTEYLDECDDDVFESLEYIMYNFADCTSDSTAGTLVVYGRRNGSILRGVVEPSMSHNLPKFGKWHAPMTALIIDELEVIEGNNERVLQICRKLMEMSQYDDLSLEGNILLYAMNNALLDTREKIEGFVTHASELVSLLCPSFDNLRGDYVVKAGFVDISSTGPNLLNINIDRHGNLQISTALSISGEAE